MVTFYFRFGIWTFLLFSSCARLRKVVKTVAANFERERGR